MQIGPKKGPTFASGIRSILRQNQAIIVVGEIRNAAIQGGMRFLRDDSAAKVLAGITTPDEVDRVTDRADVLSTALQKREKGSCGVRERHSTR